MNVAVVGCGLIGTKRAMALGKARLVACADAHVERAEKIARGWPGCEALSDWRAVVSRPDVDAVIVATPNHVLAEIATDAVTHGKHVLIEKPAARSAAELRPLADLARASKVIVRVGFNHRYHRAFRHCRQLIDDEAVGPLMFLRARYGHGGRPGYDKEWRADPRLSGGGELIDQGSHLIDLSRWVLGDFEEIDGYAHTYYWKMPVDDNAFLLLKTAAKQVAFLHVSCTEWKNTFSFEIYGEYGKLQIDGLGGSYGTERLTHYRMLPAMGPPETTIWEYPMSDDSWEVEMGEFFEDIRLARRPAAGLEDALAMLDIVERIYERSRHDYRA